MKASRNAWIWLLPLAAGGVAYLWPVGAEKEGGAAKAQGGDREARAVMARRGDGRAVFQELQAARDARNPLLRNPPPDGAELRRLLLDLKSRYDVFAATGKFSPESEAVYAQADEIALELVKEEGAPALHWLEENWPYKAYAMLDEWAKSHPQEALAYLEQETRASPCNMDTVLELLTGRAQSGGPEALAETVRRIPWELFRESAGIYKIPSEMDAGVWVSSGAARYLAEQGVEVDGALEQLMKKSPELAVETWLDWDRRNPQRTHPTFELVMAAGYASPEVQDAAVAALIGAGPAALDRLKDDLESLKQSESIRALRAKLFPPPEAAAEAGPGE